MTWRRGKKMKSSGEREGWWVEMEGRMDERMLFNVTSRVSNDSICYVSDSDALGITARWPPAARLGAEMTDRATELSRGPGRPWRRWLAGPALGDDDQPAGQPFIRTGQPGMASQRGLVSSSHLTFSLVTSLRPQIVLLFLSLFYVACIIPGARDYYMYTQQSRAVARKPRDAAAVIFVLKFVDNIHYKCQRSQASKARLHSSKHTGAKQNLTQNGHSRSFNVTCFGVSGKVIRD